MISTRKLALYSLTFTIGAMAQQPAADPSAAKTYAARCASCHGPSMTGGSQGPSILSWIRYHTDAEVSALLAKGIGKMPAVTLPDAERRALLSDLRVLAGTNPTMATGGFTGQRPARGGGGGRGAPAAGRGPAGRGAAPQAGDVVPLPAVAPKASPDRTGQQATIQLKGSRTTLTGKILSDYTNAATILTADGKIHLLARDGDAYTEKKIEPKLDWTTYHGTIEGNRYSKLEQINTSNVTKLAPAWVFPMNVTRLEASPIVVDGIMYITAWNEIHALDATTGQELWGYSEPHTEGIYSEAGNGANRGPAVAGDHVFLMTDSARLISFERKTGAKQWEVTLGRIEDSVSSSGAPMVVGDLVIVGVAGGEEGVRGFLDAYKVSDGKRAWRFYTVPSRGEKGSETWAGAALEHGCGATWLTGSYDPSLDLLYWAIGNPCPDFNGDERMGDNLYTSSVVALSPKTGQMKWYYQFTPHDTHDWDATEPLILVDEQWEGRPRKLMLHGDRNGMFYVLDRTNGQFLLASKLSTKVTWNSGYTKEGKPILTSTFDATPDGVALCPGSTGGTNWQEAAYSPLTKLFYARVADSCGIYQSHPDPLNAGNRWYGRGTGPSPEAQKALAELLVDYPASTVIRAVDPFTGKKVWDYTAPGLRSGVLSTAGGLVFLGARGGMAALDGKTGQSLWSVDLGQPSSSSAMTYMVGGKQYVALSGSNSLVAYAIPGN